MVSEKSVFFFIFLIPDFTFAIVSFHVSNRFVVLRLVILYGNLNLEVTMNKNK